METLLIIDGNNLLFQMFYGMPSKIYNKSGKTIHATIGFISYLLKQIKLLNATKVVVVFDSDASIEREEEYKDYKKNRTNNWDSLPADEIPFNEEEYIVKCLEYLNITTIYSEGMEADDVIASLALKFSGKVYISSFDSDFFQLINDSVSVIRYRGKSTVIYDKDLFLEKFDFEPSKYVLYKSLVGDNSDNIKGVSGIGKVRATSIVKQINNIDDISKLEINEKIKLNILNNIDIIKRNIKLIELKYKYMKDVYIKDFDIDKINQTNSKILSACNVFD